MTKREAAIISAYTGWLLGEFRDCESYIEEVMDRPVFTHEMGSKVFTEVLHARCKPDFMNLKLEESEPMLHSGLSVAKLKMWDKYDCQTVYSYEVLYEHISDPEDALLLAQLAMCDKDDNELIFIFPGGINIKKNHEKLYKEALRLAEKYKYEPYKKKED